MSYVEVCNGKSWSTLESSVVAQFPVVAQCILRVWQVGCCLGLHNSGVAGGW